MKSGDPAAERHPHWELLRRMPLLAGLPEQDLERLFAMADPVAVQPGQVVMEEGTTGDEVYIILEGSFQVTKRSGKQDVLLSERGAGELLGEISLLERSARTATVRSLGNGQLLRISQETFQALLATSPSAALAVVHTVMDRLRNTESALLQHQKMAALGAIAAGLAHELNNPAAAVLRSTAQLRQATADWQHAALELQASGLSRDCIDQVEELRGELDERSARPVDLDPLAFSDREDEIRTWLEGLGVDGAWELAAPLVATGWDVPALSHVASTFQSPQVPMLARWLATGGQVHSLLRELGLGAERIAETVKAVKSYSYLDQAPVQEVDVVSGIEDTLIILRHKLKSGVVVRREYAAGLPRIEAYASELNQVWTNLIDNAIDAMQGKGDLTITTSARHDSVVVEICDTGPGIPPEIQDRIFDPFFSTKGAGGLGLGLHIVYHIVVQKHAGQVSVASQPGRTCFRVALPLRLPPATRAAG